MGTREGRQLNILCVLLYFSVLCVAFSQESTIIGKSESRSGSFPSDREDRTILIHPLGIFYQYFPYLLSPKSSPLEADSVPLMRHFYKSFYDDHRSSNLVMSSCTNSYLDNEADSSSNLEYCTSAINCLSSAAIPLIAVNNENTLLQSFIRLGSSALKPTCLYLSKDGNLKDGICCKMMIGNSANNSTSDSTSNLNNALFDENAVIPYDIRQQNHPKIDRGHIFARPDNFMSQNFPIIRPAFTPSSSEIEDSYPFNRHPTHPPLPTHPPELTNKPWWTTKPSIKPTTTPPPKKHHDWWEIRKTVIPQWWEDDFFTQSTKPTQWWQPETTTKPTLQTTMETSKTPSKLWTTLKTTRWWVPSTTTMLPLTQIWERQTSLKEDKTTTSTLTTSTTTTTTTRPPLNQGTNFCMPLFFKSEEVELLPEVEEDTGSTRITGGSSISPHSFPWIAVLFQGEKHVCGGSLIDENHVLTAAHCVATLSNWQLRQMTVYLGMHDLTRVDGSKQAYTIKTVIKHKDYSRSLLYNDVAILTLNEQVKFTEKVHPICLYEGSSSFFEDFATVAGWGSLYEGGNQLDTPRKVELRIWSNENCKQTYGSAAPGGIISSHLCAGKHGKDACSGDSGGPIMKKMDGVWMQIGIVSWGIGCGKGHYPGVYSRISSFLPWIRKVQAAY